MPRCHPCLQELRARIVQALAFVGEDDRGGGAVNASKFYVFPGCEGLQIPSPASPAP